MKLKSTLVVSGLLAAALAACSDGSRQSHSPAAENETPAVENAPAEGEDANREDVRSFSNAQIFTLLSVINSGEIDSSRLAQSRSQNQDVIAFAGQLVIDHTELDSALNSFAIEANLERTESEASRWFASQGQNLSDVLTNLNGADLDRKFLSSQVDMHEWAIEQIDLLLAREGADASMNDLLTRTRTLMQTHLTRAQELVTQVGDTQPAPDGESDDAADDTVTPDRTDGDRPEDSTDDTTTDDTRTDRDMGTKGEQGKVVQDKIERGKQAQQQEQQSDEGQFSNW